MKVLLLIIGIYALIFNQASKQIDVKASMEVKHTQKQLRAADNTYLYRESITPEISPSRHIPEEMIYPSKMESMLQPAIMRQNKLQQSMFYPIYYPNAVNVDGRKS